MRPSAIPALALCALAAAGCLPRLSDPFFAFRELGAPEAAPGQSLVFGTIELESGFFGPGDPEEVLLRRLRPEQEEIRRVASERIPFRAFRIRQFKDGHFLLALEPGAYELQKISCSALTDSSLEPDEDGKRATRFTVTRPAVIDLGVLRIAPAPGLGSYSLTLRPANDPARAALLRAAIAGTEWESLEPRGAYR